MLVKASPVRDADGEVVMAVNIMEEVTDARRAEHQQRFLAGASKLLSAALDVDATLDRAAAAIVPELADWCCVDMPDERGRLQRRALAAGRGRRAELDALRDAFDLDGDDGPPARCATAARGCSRMSTTRCCARGRVDDAALETLRAAGAAVGAIVPLMAGDRTIGAMTSRPTCRPACWPGGASSSPRRSPCAPGIAVENARVHGVAHAHRATLQRSLLPPRLPAVPGMTIAARFRAAGEATDVGGDFYDIFAVDGAWMVVMGDVTGKGPEAASITSLARYTMRTAAVYERVAGGRARAAERGARRRPRPPPDLHGRGRAGRHRPHGRPGHRRVRRHPAPFRLHDGRADPFAAAGRCSARSRRALAGDGRAASRRARASCSTPTASPTRAARPSASARSASRTSSPAATELDPDEVANRVDTALLAFEEGPQRDDVALLVLRATRGAGADASLVAVGAGAEARGTGSPRRRKRPVVAGTSRRGV